MHPRVAIVVTCVTLLAAPGPASARPSPAKLAARLLADNDHIRRTNPAAFRRKLEVKMQASPFAYFRGTTARFDHRLRKQDRDRPLVLSNGDVHPLNFGVLQPAGGRPRWLANDQDEAYRAPYTWDLKRGAVGFELMAAEHGISGGKRGKIVRAFVEAYLDGVKQLATAPAPGDPGRPPKLVRKLLALSAEAQSHPERFYSSYLNADGTFIRRDRYAPVSVDASSRRTYATYLHNLRGERPGAARELAGYRITGAAIKETNGVGSMGLKRYLLALRRTDGGGSPLLLELKEQREPALARYVSAPPANDPARRVHRARVLQTAGGERFDGFTSNGGVSYQVMTLGPHQVSVEDLGQPRLGSKEARQLARACGAALAEAHLQWGAGPTSTSRALARQILADAGRGLDRQIARFAQETATKVTAEHAVFRQLLERNAFGL